MTHGGFLKVRRMTYWRTRSHNISLFHRTMTRSKSRKKQKKSWGHASRLSWGYCTRKCILEDKEPNWDGGQYAKQKDFWDEFKQYRQSEEYLKLSRKNKENSLKVMNPHKLSSRGYASKMDEFERELEAVECLGIEPETANWDPR